MEVKKVLEQAEKDDIKFITLQFTDLCDYFNKKLFFFKEFTSLLIIKTKK